MGDLIVYFHGFLWHPDSLTDVFSLTMTEKAREVVAEMLKKQSVEAAVLALARTVETDAS